MRSPYAMRRVLLEAEETIHECNDHFQLTGDFSIVSLTLEGSGDVDFLLLRNRLNSLLGTLPLECHVCSVSGLRLYDLRDEIDEELKTPPGPPPTRERLPNQLRLRSTIGNTYPFPIAGSYSQILEVENARGAVERVIHTFDFAYRYCAYLLLASISFDGKQEAVLKQEQGEMWKSLVRPGLGWDGLGRIVDKIGRHFELPHPCFRSLLAGIQASRDDIQRLVDLRNKVAHDTGGYSPDFTSEDLTEGRKEAQESLERFLWQLNCLLQMPLLYLRRPVNYIEEKTCMEYEIAYCMGSTENFRTKNILVSRQNLQRNQSVSLWLAEDQKDGTPQMLIPLFPLLVAFPATPKAQIYIYHDYDSKKGQYIFVHPFHQERFITGRNSGELFDELEKKIRYGSLSSD